MVDTVKGERKLAILEKLVDGQPATGPVAIVVEGNEAARHDSIVKRFETQFDGLVPVGVDVQEGNLRDADGGKGVLELARNDAHASEVRAGAAKEARHAAGAGGKITNPRGGFRAVGGGGGGHALEGIEEPNGARQAGVRGQAGENGGGAAFVNAAFDDIAGDLLVLDALGEAGQILDALGAEHGVVANEPGDALLGEAGFPILEQLHEVERLARKRAQPHSASSEQAGLAVPPNAELHSVPTRSGLNAIGNGGLHAIEEKEAAEDYQGDDCGRRQQKQARCLPAAGDGPAETVNDPGHGVEAVEPAPARRNKRGRIGDGRGEHPELDEERNDVADVAIKRVERGEPQANPKSGEEGESQQRGQPQRGKTGADAVSDGENGEHDEADGEVHQAGKCCGNGKYEAREINFSDQALVVHDDAGGHLQGVGEISPGDKRGKIENGIREALGGELGEASEEKSKDEHGKDGLENDPEDTDGGLLVADLDVAPDEKVEELAVGPDFAEAKLEEAAGRLDANGGGGAGVQRESGAGLPDTEGIGVNGVRSGDRGHA